MKANDVGYAIILGSVWAAFFTLIAPGHEPYPVLIVSGVLFLSVFVTVCFLAVMIAGTKEFVWYDRHKSLPRPGQLCMLTSQITSKPDGDHYIVGFVKTNGEWVCACWQEGEFRNSSFAPQFWRLLPSKPDFRLTGLNDARWTGYPQKPIQL